MQQNNIIYVGQTDNFNRRIEQHQRDKIFDSAHIIQMVPPEKSAFRAEWDWIELIRTWGHPLLNKREPFWRDRKILSMKQKLVAGGIITV